MLAESKKFLNVGGHKKSHPVPSCFNGWQQDLLDIDPDVMPDILCDAREMWKMEPRQYDAVYCSHNLEHFHWHDLQKVLKGCGLVLKKEGFIYIRVPDLLGVMRYVAEHNLDLTDRLYLTRTGSPIAALDVIYGFRKQIESSGADFFCHKSGFSSAALEGELKKNGFPFVFLSENNLAFELSAIAFMQPPSPETIALLGLGPHALGKSPETEKGPELQGNAIHAANMMEKGEQLFSAKSLDSAEEYFTGALSGLNELVAHALFGLGKIACNRSEFDKALDYLARAREADPCISDPYCLTAEIYFALNDMVRAKEWCGQALEVNWNDKNAHYILSRIDLPGPDYYANIEMIHQFLHPRTYLEIGVDKGDTLKFAGDETLAIGVDPSPKVEVPLGRLTRVYEKTSDDFFCQVELEKEFAGQPVELAFIDGMHQFEFALRDFINIEKYCTGNSVVMVHDCCPLDEITAARERITDFWSGDIWKLIVCLKKYRPDLRINVIGTYPTGLAIITGLNKESQILADSLEEIYAEFIDMDYGYLNEDKAVKLNLVPNKWDVIKGILTH